MLDIMTWQAFQKEDGTLDPDKGSVVTVFRQDGSGAEEVHNLTRVETATMLEAFGLTVSYLDQARQRAAEKAFGNKGEDARV